MSASRISIMTTTKKTTAKKKGTSGRAKGRVNRDIFVSEYIKTGNGTEAYKKACSNKKITDETAASNAYQLLRNTEIAKKVEESRQLTAKQCQFSVEDVLREAVSMYQKLSKDEVTPDGFVKTRDASNAKGFLEMAGKILGAFAKDNEQKTDLKHSLKMEGIEGWAEVFPSIEEKSGLTPEES